MFHFFVAQSKVQKDRTIMRETDARMAKYSRRGLVLNFLVFLLCVLFGNFEQQYHNEAVILVSGLLLVTLGRSYFLFRFDELYARAPTRWRNQYFFASCLGAAWWSVILVTLTWLQGMRGETLVMWFYSVVFYSSVANVFAPYRRFLTIYLAIGQIPAAMTAIILGDHESILYGCIMITFFIMIVHQGKVTSLAYWERLEGIFVLRERAQNLEEETRSSQAKLQLKNEFLVNLGQEFRSSISDVIGTLALIDEKQLSEQHRELLTVASKAAGRQIDLVNNVVDFSKITTRTLALDAVEFDLRRALEKTIQDFSLDAYQQGIEIFYLFDPAMPLRVKGDLQRMNQVLNTLMNYALKASRLDHIYIEVRFVQEQETAGQLQLTISNTEKPVAQGDEAALEPAYRGIGLAISKGLAECMDGSVQLREEKNRGLQVFIRLGLGIVAHEEHRFGAEQKFIGKQVLLVDWPESNAQGLAAELQVWGMQVQQVYGREALLARLNTGEKAVDLLLLYTRLGNMNALALSADIAAQPGGAGLAQILVMSGLQIDSAETKRHLRQFPQVAVLEKPVIRKRLYDLALQRLFNHEPRNLDGDSNTSLYKVLLVEDHRVDQMVISAMLKKLGCYVQVAKTGLEALEVLALEEFDLLLLDYDMKEQESLEAAQKIRALEQEQTRTGHGSRHLPIVAVTASQLEADEGYIAAGMDDYIAKPIRYDDLENRLQRWLGTER